MHPNLRWVAVAPLALAAAACGGVSGPKQASDFHPSHPDRLAYMDVLQRTHSPLTRLESQADAVTTGKTVCAMVSRQGYADTFKQVRATWRAKDPAFSEQDTYDLIVASVNHLCAGYKDKLPADGANPFPA